MPDDIRSNRAKAAKQFDKMFGAAGSLIESYDPTGIVGKTYGKFLKKFGTEGFFENFTGLQHLNTPEGHKKYMPGTEEYKQRQKRKRQKAATSTIFSSSS